MNKKVKSSGSGVGSLLRAYRYRDAVESHCNIKTRRKCNKCGYCYNIFVRQCPRCGKRR